ncbi:MAG: bifunctional diaminohydroxyphosphoribosylaminopyrimidine deaminase/5-amino-6-(5-phosphoribosylamino)uracil reductase RibD [Ideonella sp.]|nr:bifunctional diaminohydroxyphosphoribosylaminopyrimidine deaminase/5-amino-6-(5-phosphoribosylamino)uracil reductase RibD [Ideonella sp.]
MQPNDEVLLARANELAAGAIGLSEPNPRVGCVLHTADGRLAGEGFTQQVGGPHAEVMALRAAAAAGIDVQGGTAWVSLEPCAHHGRTPPCCDALIGAGLARVVVAMVDPFPQVAGLGIARLRAAGIDVTVAPPGPVVTAACELNIGFLSRVLRQRPWVRLKIAASLDGRTALPNGVSQWITGAEARADGHAWRRRAGAVLTGIGTVLSDDPRLDVRKVPTHVQPLRVVVDSMLQTPPSARLLQAPGQALIAHAGAPAARIEVLSGDAHLVAITGSNGQVDLAGLLVHLARLGVNELHVEAGAKLNAALLQANLVDELLVYLAPTLLGDGRSMASLGPFNALAQAKGFEFTDVARVGDDLRLVARPIQTTSWLRRGLASA